MKYVCLACLLWVMKNTHAQTTEAAISKTLNTFFHAMKNADSALLRQQFAPGAMMQTVVQLPDGTTTVRNQSVTAFLESIARMAEGDAEERITHTKPAYRWCVGFGMDTLHLLLQGEIKPLRRKCLSVGENE